ncbi:MAG: hypothetical protein LBJ11_03865 [Oscillospiraceae bacterium]|jgi:hypothetical protein|nr:hypothetical protein [Oscillospiraceae bacterium]
MSLRLLADRILDMAATEQELAYIREDTGADGAAFGSFFLCDWESFHSVPITKQEYIHLKFGAAAPAIEATLGDYLSCAGARLPKGGCAVLFPDGEMHWFRSDGAYGGGAALLYQNSPAQEIACLGDGAVWATIPDRNALVRFSVRDQSVLLRVGGEGVFPRPTGLFRSLEQLLVCCEGNATVSAMTTDSYEAAVLRRFPEPPRRFIRVFGQEFVWMGSGLYAVT